MEWVSYLWVYETSQLLWFIFTVDKTTKPESKSRAESERVSQLKVWEPPWKSCCSPKHDCKLILLTHKNTSKELKILGFTADFLKHSLCKSKRNKRMKRKNLKITVSAWQENKSRTKVILDAAWLALSRPLLSRTMGVYNYNIAWGQKRKTCSTQFLLRAQFHKSHKKCPIGK